MSLFFLYTEAFLDLVAIVLGLVVIFRARDNNMRLWWGVLALIVGSVLLHDNIVWIVAAHTGTPHLDPAGAHCCRLLDPGRMLKWFVLAFVSSLFPLTSLRPGYCTPLRLLIFALPVGAVVLVMECYMLFNGRITELHSLRQIAENAGELDVRVRLGIFAATIILPLAYFLAPVLRNLESVRRRSSRAMTAYVWAMWAIIAYYIAFTLLANNFLFNTYGLVMILFFITFSILFLLHENPFSSRIRTQQDSPKADKKTLADILYIQMEAHFARQTPYVNPDYSPEELARELNTRQSLAIEAIKSGGFTGFREYMNYLRVEHFKRLAQADRSRAIKELMHLSGFNSRSSFYRIFTTLEQVTPKEYIDRLAPP